MTILHTSPCEDLPRAVRLVGIGHTGMRFVQRFFAGPVTKSDSDGRHAPLTQLQQETPSFIWIEGGEVDALVDRSTLGDTRLLLLAFGADACRAEIEAAMHLVWDMWDRDGHIMAIVIGGRDTLVPSTDTMLGLLCDAVDARIDVADDSPEEMEPVQWFYLGLRRAILDGQPLVLEAAWDCDDVVETLSFPAVELMVQSESFDNAAQLSEAMTQALEELQRREPQRPIERAQGMVMVLWAPRDYRLTVRDVRGIGRQAAAAMGAGALHLTIRVSVIGQPQIPGVLTVVVSFARPSIYLSPL